MASNTNRSRGTIHSSDKHHRSIGHGVMHFQMWNKNRWTKNIQTDDLPTWWFLIGMCPEVRQFCRRVFWRQHPPKGTWNLHEYSTVILQWMKERSKDEIKGSAWIRMSMPWLSMTTHGHPWLSTATMVLQFARKPRKWSLILFRFCRVWHLREGRQATETLQISKSYCSDLHYRPYQTWSVTLDMRNSPKISHQLRETDRCIVLYSLDCY